MQAGRKGASTLDGMAGSNKPRKQKGGRLTGVVDTSAFLGTSSLSSHVWSPSFDINWISGFIILRRM